MTTTLAFNVNGTPGAQGSKKGFAVKKGGKPTGKVVMVESSEKVEPWRSDVKAAAERACEAAADQWAYPAMTWTPLAGPVHVGLEFRFPRPKAHYRTGSKAHLLRDDAPLFVTSRAHGDADKLARSTLDALVAAGVLADDSLVVVLHVTKRYCAEGQLRGADIYVRDLTPTRAVA